MGEQLHASDLAPELVVTEPLIPNSSAGQAEIVSPPTRGRPRGSKNRTNEDTSGQKPPIPPTGDPPGVEASPDPFDPRRFRLRQDFASTAAAKTEVTEVTVGKPSKQEFIRVHPSPDYRLDAAIIEYERLIYLIVPKIADGGLRDHVNAVTLFTVQNTQRVTYLWPVNLPKDGRSNSWTDSARELAAKAMVQTIQVKSNHNPKAQRYDAIVPIGKPPEPEWPNLTFSELLRLAFRDRIIDSLEHPVARRLLGITFD